MALLKIRGNISTRCIVLSLGRETMNIEAVDYIMYRHVLDVRKQLKSSVFVHIFLSIRPTVNIQKHILLDKPFTSSKEFDQYRKIVYARLSGKAQHKSPWPVYKKIEMLFSRSYVVI